MYQLFDPFKRKDKNSSKSYTAYFFVHGAPNIFAPAEMTEKFVQPLALLVKEICPSNKQTSLQRSFLTQTENPNWPSNMKVVRFPKRYTSPLHAWCRNEKKATKWKKKDHALRQMTLPFSSRLCTRKTIAYVASKTQYFTSARFHCARTVPGKNELGNVNTKVPSFVYVLTTSLQFYLVGSF